MFNLNFLKSKKNYYIKLISLFIFWEFIKKHPNLKKYKPNIIFSVYRSLFCIFFMFYSLENLINNFSDLFTDILIERDCYNDITEWFIIYLIFDLIKMIHLKNKRIDLYVHHVYCLVSVMLAKSYNVCHSIYNLPLIAEAISVVSGLDSMAMEDNNMDESYYYKLYRKGIIKYIRLPIWIISLLLTIKNTHCLPKIVWYSAIFGQFMMLGLDNYWEKKCNKVIKKYENKNEN
jgi:hypothetical protein